MQSHRLTSTPPTTPQATASNTPLPILPELFSNQRHIQHGKKHSPSRSHCHKTGQPWPSTTRNQRTVPPSRRSHSPLVRQCRLQLHSTTWSLEILLNAPVPPHLSQPTRSLPRKCFPAARARSTQAPPSLPTIAEHFFSSAGGVFYNSLANRTTSPSRIIWSSQSPHPATLPLPWTFGKLLRKPEK
jgi:hypothetical protein